ncbi:Cyclopropane-fatty-acyl-phospholipid synthase [Pleurostoma richardsiae]|uniref:Cyclopropane-fatty-acyl-phospholipid synthase n=1 Tax=Pleurostoma richardsiae TaxID=41990 RepID=A0AA38RIL2_9PEZI|nr:Cyclopropane-fatty-acyl-phospholipid synthase [Pleurostoma richardsiae]
MLPSLPSAVQRPLSRSTEALRGVLGGLTWGPAMSIVKPAVLSTLAQIEVGTLLLTDEPTGTRYVYGQALGSTKSAELPTETNGVRRAATIPRVELVVKKEAFWMRVFLFADMGFSESYMLGEVECADLTAFFQLFIANRGQMGDGTTWLSTLSTTVSALARSTNTLSNSLLNISAHYDISNDMFAAFLSPDMTYSCPIWSIDGEKDGREETLEEAQMTKLHRFIDGAHIKSTDHVLEIGTGWGSFAIEAKALAEERIREAGFADKIEVRLMDYRALPTDTTYDKIISIEMLEAVGQEFLSTYFSCINHLLKEDGGIAVFQCITMPEGRHEAYSKSEDFINHYIFPGGYLPSITQLLNHISKESAGTLIVERVENIGGHYAKTLRLWREQFLANFDEKIRPALRKEHQGMSDEEIEVFLRKWEYYFTYCEAGFITKTLGDVIITVGREGAMELMEGVPV